MKKNVMKVGSVIVLSTITLVLYVWVFYRQRPSTKPDSFPYSLPSEEIATLKQKGSSGDCEASYRLAKYYFYGALDIDTGTEWLRIAAKSCTDPAVKEYLLYNLLQDKNPNAEKIGEIKQLMSELKEIDPTRAAKWSNDVADAERRISPR